MNASGSHGDRYFLSSSLMLFSAGSFALSGFFAERAIAHTDFWFTLFVRFLIPLVLLLPAMVIWWRRRYAAPPDKLHLLRATSLVISQGLFFLASVKVSLFDAMVLYNTGPLFMLLISGLRGGGRLVLSSLAGAIVGFVGVTLTLWVGLRDVNFYSLAGLGSGVFLAISQLSLHASARQGDHFGTMLYTYGLGTLLALLPFLAFTQPWNAAVSGWFAPAALIGLALMALFSIGNQWLRGLAYQRIADVSVISPIIYSTIAFSMLLDGVFNGRRPSWLSVAGAILVIVGACFPVVIRGWNDWRARVLARRTATGRIAGAVK